MAEWLIEPLRPEHQRSDFSCGVPSLDSFLRTLVSQYEKRCLGRTFVATEPGSPRIAGYYTLAAGSVAIQALPPATAKKLPKHPAPTIHLGRLAVDQAYRGRRLGEFLLFHALQAALELSKNFGAFAVDVRAVDDQAAAFYQKYGFRPLTDDLRHLYLPMNTIATMFAADNQQTNRP